MNLLSTGLIERAKDLLQELNALEGAEKIEAINAIKILLHEKSPFSQEPVDCVIWIPFDEVSANDYNPNTVAPPEMKLLETSIREDGYTQPIVTFKTEAKREVVDGFHRNRVGRESKIVRERVMGYLPVVTINEWRADLGDRMAATIRHNRARGKHRVEAMSDIVVELKRRNWSDEKICSSLGMEQDEVLRLCQITGLAELFSDQDFSKSWDAEGVVTEADFKEISDDVESYGPEETKDFRTVNTSDEKRIFHTHDKWECFKAGFYNNTKEGMSKTECEQAYFKFLADCPRFAKTCARIISEWKHSCEHYLTNTAMNRIAWMGQAAACLELGIPSSYRGGFYLLNEDQQRAANEVALKYVNEWMVSNSRPVVTMEEAYSGDRQSDIY